MDLTITTNNQWRNFLYGYEVPEKVMKEQFDYLGGDANCDGFICYKGNYYHLCDFMRIDTNSPFDTKKWSGYVSDSFFSGILIKVSDDGEHYKIGWYCS